MGTPDFAAASLQRLIDDEHFEVVAVVSQPDRPAGRKMQLTPSPVKILALEKGLPVFTPETVNTDEFRLTVLTLKPESAAVVAFGQILGQKFLDLFPRGCVNVHGSILPRWRGAAPIQRAVMSGDRESGVALQIVVRKLDAGPVLGIRRVELDDSINALQLHDQLKDLGADLLHVEYMDYLRGNLMPTPQDEADVTIAPKIDKAEALIDWSLSAREIHNKVRGLQMGPFAYSTLDQRAVKIHRTMIVSESGSSGAPGSVISQHASGFHVACGAGVLDILDVQPESKPRMTASAFALGYLTGGGKKFV
jgi:methionyl-tRNA formyltransferase